MAGAPLHERGARWCSRPWWRCPWNHAAAQEWAQFRGPGAAGVVSDNPESARAVERRRKRRVADADSGPRVELAHCRRRLGVRHHRRERRRGGVAREWLVPRGRAPHPARMSTTGWSTRSTSRPARRAGGPRSTPACPPSSHHLKNTFASETPVTDGERLYVLFGNVGLYALGFDGTVRWSRDLPSGGDPQRVGHGVVAGAPRRPRLPRRRQRGAVVPRGPERRDRSRAVAHRPRRGEQLVDPLRLGARRAHRDRHHRHRPGAVLRPRRPGAVGAVGHVVHRHPDALSPPTGCSTSSRATSPTSSVPSTRYGRARAGTSRWPRGETANQHVAWSLEQGGSYHPSPLVYGDHYYTLLDRGMMTAHDARTGAEVYGRRRIDVGQAFTASPWAYNGKIFALSEQGTTYVIEAGPGVPGPRREPPRRVHDGDPRHPRRQPRHPHRRGRLPHRRAVGRASRARTNSHRRWQREPNGGAQRLLDRENIDPSAERREPSQRTHQCINDAKMFVAMRTTIDIPDDLLRRTKAEAALRGLRLKDLVREALQRLLQETDGPPEPVDRSGLDEQTLGPDCVFPLISGTTGPVMRDLAGGGAQRLLDREDIDRDAYPR